MRRVLPYNSSEGFPIIGTFLATKCIPSILPFQDSLSMAYHAMIFQLVILHRNIRWYYALIVFSKFYYYRRKNVNCIGFEDIG
jgi:hypothetical protein